MRSRNSYGRDCIEGAHGAWGVPQTRPTGPGQTWGVPWDWGAACKVIYPYFCKFLDHCSIMAADLHFHLLMHNIPWEHTNWVKAYLAH